MLARFQVKIARSYLANPHFDLSGWYARRRTQALNLPRASFTPFQMGRSLDYVTTWLLTSAIESHFPSITPDLDPESRFYVHQFDFGSNIYIIEDVDFCLQTRILKQWLEDPTFDLVLWYLQMLEFEHQYSARYEAKQIELYHLEQNSNLDSDEFDLDLAEPMSDSEIISELENSPDPHGLEERHPCPWPAREEHRMTTCIPDLESVSNTSMCGDLAEFDWDHTDDHRDSSVWPDSDPAEEINTVYSDQWMLGFMGDAFASRLKEVLTKCQPYPGDNDCTNTFYSPESSRFFITPHEGDVYTICDSLQKIKTYLHLSKV